MKIKQYLVFYASTTVGAVVLLNFVNWLAGMHIPATAMTILAFIVSFIYSWMAWGDKQFTDDLAAQAATAQQLRASNPRDPGIAWTAARLTQELYYKRNLSQTAQIFNIAVLTMLAGFGLICWATYRSLQVGAVLQTSVVAAASGVITEFIAATFMVIYKSTMAQAAEYMKILERINNVGMAIQVISNLPESSESIVETRCAIARMLIDPRRQSDSPVY